MGLFRLRLCLRDISHRLANHHPTINSYSLSFPEVQIQGRPWTSVYAKTTSISVIPEPL